MCPDIADKTILIVEDNSSFRLFLKEALKDIALIEIAENAANAKKLLKDKKYDLAIIDMKLPDGRGLDIIEFAKSSENSTRMIILTAFGDVPLAIESIKKGALDFWQKPIDYEVIKKKVSALLNENDFKSLNKLIVGESENIENVREDVKRLANTDVNVFITGESGTGKDLVAKTIHEMSVRNLNKFMPVDFTNIKSDLFESELFGSVKGAYTGSYETHEGKIIQSNHGSIYFDNIDETDRKTQGKLLRFVQDKKYYPLGSSNEVSVDARIISSSSKDIAKCVADGGFRDDLYFRLNVYTVKLLPLREREEDIVPLARHYTEIYSNRVGKSDTILTDDILKLFAGYNWRGNVRELINLIERAFINDNPFEIMNYLKSGIDKSGLKERVKNVKEVYERKEIVNAIKLSNGNKSEASRILKISYRNLIEKVKEYRIED